MVFRRFYKISRQWCIFERTIRRYTNVFEQTQSRRQHNCPARAASIAEKMKSTKVQTFGAYCVSCSSPAYYANARARKLATPRVVAVTRGALSSRSNTG